MASSGQEGTRPRRRARKREIGELSLKERETHGLRKDSGKIGP